MLLTIDIGNTNMECAVFQGEELLKVFRLGTNRDATSDEIGLTIGQFFLVNGLDMAQVEDIVIASVVPQVMYSVNNAILKYFGKLPLVVGENLFVPIENHYDNPAEVGADRLVTAKAAFSKYGGPLVVVDFGTATTFDAVTGQGAYLGGVIYPGIRISTASLFQRTAKLPMVELVDPGHIIGRNTEQSIQAGAIYGYSGAVKNIIAEIKKVLGAETRVVATGGLVGIIAQYADFDVIDRTLMQDGLRLLYQYHRQQNP